MTLNRLETCQISLTALENVLQLKGDFGLHLRASVILS